MGDARRYLVQEGDTLESIAKAHYGVSNLKCQLASFNELDDEPLEVGETIQLPPRLKYPRGRRPEEPSGTNEEVYLYLGTATLRADAVQVLLLDDMHRPMPGAHWKAEGTVPESGTTTEDGLAEFDIEPGTEKVVISWGLESADEHTISLWLDIPGDLESGARRRLDNLGFAAGATLDEDVQAFQKRFGHQETGGVADISDVLNGLHDDHEHPSSENSSYA